MKSGHKASGFTIVETMIFLAVSGALLFSAIAVLSGPQNKIQFNQAVNDVQQQLTTVINNVANGYYPSPQAVSSCDPSTDPLTIVYNSGPQSRGTNQDCTFIGRVALFTPGANSFTVYSIAGARQTQGVNPREVESMSEAKATVLHNPDVVPLKNGVTLQSIINNDDSSSLGAIGFFTGFPQAVMGNNTQLQSGALRTDFIGLSPGVTIDSLIQTPAGNFRMNYDTQKNPKSGITLCFKSGTTSQFGVITLGGQNRTASSTLTIKDAC